MIKKGTESKKNGKLKGELEMKTAKTFEEVILSGEVCRIYLSRRFATLEPCPRSYSEAVRRGYNFYISQGEL